MEEKEQSKKTQQDLLNELHPIFRWRVETILSTLSAMGWQPKIVFAKRTEAQQTEAIARGASHTKTSWHVPSTIGVSAASKGFVQVVRGNAVDIVDRRYAWGGPAANKGFQFWNDLGTAARANSCEWGGDWKPKKLKNGGYRDQRDVAHVQMKFTEEPPQSSFTV